MRKILAAALAVPVILLVYVSALLRRSAMWKLAILGLAVALVVSGLVVGLPPKETAAGLRTTFAPLGPENFSVFVESNLGVDQPIEIPFPRAMNRDSVEAAFSVSPNANVVLSWDEAGRTLRVRPVFHWAPLTQYTVDIPGSVRDVYGGALSRAVHVPFMTGTLTSATLTATVSLGDRVSAETAFRMTFDRPMDFDAVLRAFDMKPYVSGKLTEDDPTGDHSQVFTYTPLEPLAADTEYTVTIASGTRDKRGVEISAVAPLVVRTLAGPAVVRFRPVDRAGDVDPGQAVSVRFTMAMDTTATAAAFSATADGKPVTGRTRWAENDTVLVLAPDRRFEPGAVVTLAVSGAARSRTGVGIVAPATATFTVASPEPVKPPATKPASSPIPKPKGGTSLGTAPWHSSELYYLRLMNCTRTGGWVTSSGSCSGSGHHTLPAQRALPVDKGISDRVARPFAKYMADRGILNHYADGTPKDRFLRAGYHPRAWGENIGSPYSLTGGLIHDETFFQSEYACRCDHYANIMSPKFDRAGIGIWVSHGRIRLVVDFYHP